MGLLDKITGRTKKAAGELTGSAALRREGRKEEEKGEAKEKLARAEERVERESGDVREMERRTE